MADICAVFDAQGYTIGGQFYIKELAVVSHKLTVSMLCDIPINRNELTFKERKSENIIYQKTGLPLDSDKDYWHKYEAEGNSKKVYDGEHAIAAMYEWVRDDDKPKIGYKNPQMAPIFEKWGIPAVELPQKEDKFFDVIYKMYLTTQCEYHKKPKSRCALKKAQALWYINNEKKIM
jgi:hypothetical protein